MILGVCILLIAVGLFINFKKSVYSSYRSTYQKIADQLGLDFNPRKFPFSKFIIYGQFKGYQLKIEEYTYRDDNDSIVHVTRTTLYNQGQIRDFYIKKENLWTMVAAKFGNTDIQIGDAHLDSKYVFRCSSILYFKELFNIPTINRMKEISSCFDGIIEKSGNRVILDYYQKLDVDRVIVPYLKNLSFVIYLLDRAKEID